MFPNWRLNLFLALVALTLFRPGQFAGAARHYQERGVPGNACGPCVTVARDANLRAGPGTSYPVTGAARAGQTVPVTARASGEANGRPTTWWQTTRGWIAAFLATPNAAALALPLVPAGEPATSTGTGSPATTVRGASLPDLVVLGPDTQYPVRARVVRGWDYEFVDLSSRYDIVVYRDVFGMLAHQIDDDNRRRFFPGRPPIASSGPIRITLVDAEAHPDPACAGWGWAADRDTYTPDPLGRQGSGCLVKHSLRPEGDGHGAVLLTGWAPGVGRTIAVGASGPTGPDWSTTYIAERITWPATLGPADRPDFSQPLYAALGQARKEDGRWVWQAPFVQIAPAD
jgi:hypothetical protein